MRWIKRLAIVGGASAAAMYLFDPRLGRTRRTQLAQRIGGIFRQGARRAERKSEYVQSKAYGLKEKAKHLGREEGVPPNDQALAAKIESEVKSDFPSIVVNAEDGVAVLRGEVRTTDEISAAESAVRKVTGVIDVRNLLHLPGQEAPNKQDAIDAGRR